MRIYEMPKATTISKRNMESAFCYGSSYQLDRISIIGTGKPRRKNTRAPKHKFTTQQKLAA
jgi:hypothetical protein